MGATTLQRLADSAVFPVQLRPQTRYCETHPSPPIYGRMNTMTAAAPVAGAQTPENARHAVIDVRLTDIRDAARDTNIYEFARPDGRQLPAYKPGAHVDIHLPNGLIRNYSLLNPQAEPGTYVVGIKLDAGSRGGSRYILDELKVGHDAKISPPRNNFPLAENAEPRHAVAGGIGITPIWCMVQGSRRKTGRGGLYYSAARAPTWPFSRRWRRRRGTVHLHFDDEAKGTFLDLAGAIAKAPANAHSLLLRSQPDAGGVRGRGGETGPSRSACRNISRPKPRRRQAGGFWSSSRARARNITSPRARRSSKCSTSRRRCRLFVRARHLRRVRDAGHLRHPRAPRLGAQRGGAGGKRQGHDLLRR